MDDDFKHQIPITKAIVEELWIPSLIMPGYEADDIIYTLAMKYKADKNIMIDIYSWDKDLKQLLDINVSCIDSMKWVTTTPELFVKEYVFEPIYILDYLALVWDSADNIKWIQWIWPKKASDLIQKYQTIDNIYTHIDEIGGDVKQKLIDGKEDVYKSRGLIELTHLPEIEASQLETFKLSLDFMNYKKVLIDQHHFASFEKTLDELKKKMQSPTQMGLFW